MILPTFRRHLKAQQFQHPYSVIDDLQMNLRILFYFFAFHVFFFFRQRHERRSINDEKEHNEKEGGITTMLMAYIIINHMISRTTFSCRIGHSISIIVWDWKRMR